MPLIKSCYCERLGIEKTIFADADIKIGKQIKYTTSCNAEFKLEWFKIENFILYIFNKNREENNRRTLNRIRNIKNLFIEEMVALKEYFHIDDIDSFTYESAVGTNLRIIYSEQFDDLDYFIQNFNYYSEYDDSYKDIVTVYIGKELNTDLALLLLIRDIATRLLEIKMRQDSNIKIASCNYIVLPDVPRICEAHFVMEYYCCIFRSIISVTSIREDIDIENITPAWCLSENTTKKIWDYELKYSRDKDTKTEYASIISDILSDLRKSED